MTTPTRAGGDTYGFRVTHLNGAVPFGVALIAAGVLLLLDNLGWLDGTALLADWWPVAIIGAGLWWLVGGARWIGVAVALVGTLLLATTHTLVEVHLGSLVFPTLLVVLGAALLNAGARVRTARDPDGRPLRFATVRRQPGDGDWPEGDLAATAVFGDARLVVGGGPEVGGAGPGVGGAGSAGDAIGGAGPGGAGPDAGRVTVTTLSVFGDVSIGVPAGWRVEDHTTTVFGDVSLPRHQPSDDRAPVAELHGLVLFGEARVHHLDTAGGGR